MRVTARARGLHVLNASTKYDLDAVPSRIRRISGRSNGDLLRKMYSRTKARNFGDPAKPNNVPAIAIHARFTLTGGLMSYGTSLSDANHEIGIYVGRILQGGKPADLPVRQATKVS